MGKYDDLIGGFKVTIDVDEVLNEASANKVDKRIKQQKAVLEQPIEINVKSDTALKKLAELSKTAKKIKSDLETAMSSGKEFKDLYPLVSQYEKLGKEVKKLAPSIGKNNTELKESNAILRETGKLVDKLMGVEKKPRKSRTKVVIKDEVGATQQLIDATEGLTHAQEQAAKTIVRTSKQVAAELEKELQKLKEIEAQQKKNNAARQRFKVQQANYGKEAMGTNLPLYDTDLLRGAAADLKEFNEMLNTRNQFQEKYIKLLKIIDSYYVSNQPGKYAIDNGLFKNLDEFINNNPDMRRLNDLFVRQQKTTNKDINELFKSVVRGLKSDGSMVASLIASGEAVGDTFGRNLAAEEVRLNKEMQDLMDARELQLQKINALRQEELDLVKRIGQEEFKTANIQKQKALNMDSVIKRYNKLMSSIGHEYRTIGTAFSEGTENFNLADMVNEAEYWLDAYKSEGPGSSEPDEIKIWKSEIGKLERFVNSYKPLTEGMVPNGLVNRRVEEAIQQQENLTAAIEGTIEAEKQLEQTRSSGSKVKVREFAHESEHSAYADKYQIEHNGESEYLEDVVDIVPRLRQNFNQIAADMTTSCAKATTAVQRFFSAIDPNKYPELAEWQKFIEESISNNIFSHRDPEGGWAWEVQALDDNTYYVSLIAIADAQSVVIKQAQEIQQKLLATSTVSPNTSIVDKEELETIKKENGALEEKLELLQEIAEQYASTVSQRDRDRYEELNQKDMNEGLTSRQEERFWELGEAIMEADEALEAFGNTYEKITIKLATGRKIDILPDDSGLKKFDKIANEYYSGEYNGVEIADVIFSRIGAVEQLADAYDKAAASKIKYYDIDERAAKLAKEMRSFDSYKEGSATASYKAAVDELAAIVEEKKKQFPDQSEKLDKWLDMYAKNLATYINRDNQIGAQYPSVMISGAGNYNMRKHDKQMASWGKNFKYYDEKVASLEDKIRHLGSSGSMPIRGDDADALEKLEAKLAYMKYWHDIMVEANKYYRKNKTLDGMPGVDVEELKVIKDSLAAHHQVGMYDSPYPSYALSNDSQEIKRLEGRIKELKRLKSNTGLQEENEFYKLWEDKQDMRIRISFEMGKPDREVIDMLKGKAFKWSPKNNAWQRQLTDNAIYATKQLQTALHDYFEIANEPPKPVVEAVQEVEVKKLTSAYDGLAEAVERYVSTSKQLWDAYDKHEDFGEFADARNAAVAKIASFFPPDSTAGISGVYSQSGMAIQLQDMFTSRNFADKGAEAALQYIEKQLGNVKQELEEIDAKKLRFDDGTILNDSQVAAVSKYCAVLKKQMGETYDEAMALRGALELVFDIANGNVGNLMDRFHNGNPASNAVLGLLTDMDVKNQKQRDAALRSVNPDAYDQIIAEQKAAAEKAKAELKAQKSGFQKQWDEFVSAMIGGDAFEGESNLVKGKILKAFADSAETAVDAVHELNKSWLEGKFENRMRVMTGSSKWLWSYIGHLDTLQEYADSVRYSAAGAFDSDSLLGGSSETLTEEKAQALKAEAAAWDELIAKKKEYYGIHVADTDTTPKIESQVRSTGNIVQLTDSYGDKLDEVNNKLMQGTKLLNEQGQVLKLFHNSPEIFDQFDTSRAGTRQGTAFGAGNYLALHQNGEFNTPTYGQYQTQWYANVKNPFNAGDRISLEQAESVINKFMADKAESFKQHMLSKLLEYDVINAMKDIADIAKTTAGEVFNSIGYDAVMDGTQINVFDPSQLHRANESVLDIGTSEFETLRELQQQVWDARNAVANLKREIKELDNKYIGKTQKELDSALWNETLIPGWGSKKEIAKIASVFKSLTGELPKADGISEEKMSTWVEEYEASAQGIQALKENLARQEALLETLVPQLEAQRQITDAITQSYLTGDISGIVGDTTAANTEIQVIEIEQQNDLLEDQVVIEEQVGDAVKKTTNTIKGQTSAIKDAMNALTGMDNVASNVSIEELVAKDIEEALTQLRGAKNNETTLFSLKGVFEGDDLIDQAHAMIQNIAAQSNLSLGKFIVKDDIIKVQLYNEELKVTVDQMYRLKEATEMMESAQLVLESQSFSQNVKALYENSFDTEGVQQRALAEIAKVKASLHGLVYDLSDLEKAANNIASQEDFTRFNNQLKAAQDNIQAIKNSTVSKSSMNPLANMQRDMQNANIEIETMRLKLEKFGNIEGVAQARQMLDEMTAAVKQFNGATDATGQQSAYNQYSNLRSSFKAQTDYINAAKSLNDSKAASDKNTDPIRQQYEAILDLVNKINTASSNILKYQAKDGGSGMFSGLIEQLQSERAQLISEFNSMANEIGASLSSGFVQGDQFNVPLTSFLKDSGAISSFLNNTETQAALTRDEIDRLIVSLQKAQTMDVNSITKGAEQFKSVQDTAKRLSNLTNLDGSNTNVQSLMAVYQHIMELKERISLDSAMWTPEDAAELQQAIDYFTQYGNALAQVAEKEQRYFANKQKYTHSMTTADVYKQEADQLNSVQQQLEQAAQTFAKESGAGGAFVTNFTQNADGISRLDFSVFDTATNSLRNFRMEMGNVTNGMFVTETTVDKSLARIQAAQKQLQATSNLLGKLDASGVNVGGDSAAPQIANMTRMYQALLAEINKGSNADNNIITKLTQDLKSASSDVEKLYKQMLQMHNLVGSGGAIKFGSINPNGDVYGQLSQKAREFAAAQGNATLEIGRFDGTTNTLNASLVRANGTVEQFKVSMYGLAGEVAVQQTGVGQLANSWHTFTATLKRSVARYANMFSGFYMFYRIIAVIREGINYVKELDLAMTELKKVTDATAEAYENFLKEGAKTAGEIGATISEYTEATANFARLGYSMGEASEMAKTAIVYKNVADGIDNIEESTDSIISTMKAFGIESNNTMQIVDIFNHVGKYIAQTT